MTENKTKFEINGSEFDSNIDNIKSAIDHLNKFKDQSKLTENEEAAEAFHLIYVMTAFYISSNPELIDIYEEKNLIKIIYNVNDYLSSICVTLKVPGDQSFSKLDGRKTEILRNSIQTLNFLTINSVQARLKYFQLGGAKSLLKLLDTDKFTKKFQNDEIINKIVSNLNWLSKTADFFKNEWNELQAVDIFLKVDQKYPSTKLIAYMAFANIANDKHIDTLAEVNDVIIELMEIIDFAADSVYKGNVTREYQPFIESDDQTTNSYEVYVVPVDKYKIRFTLTGILLVLNKLAVNDTIRSEIYIKFNLRDALRKIIMSGSLIEKRYALHVLAQLCFDHQVVEELAKDVELSSNIERMVKTENCSIKSMRKLCEQIIWCIKMKNSIPDVDLIKPTSKDQTHVVISYNTQSKDLCLKIKEELEKCGFKVLIDINNGSSINEMTKCVETCDYFLMCVTEKYRQSVHCQAEAQYSFKLRKKVIPLIMQKGYRNVNGWLGPLMDDRNNISFNNESFDQSMSDLLKELGVKNSSSNLQRSENNISRVKFQRGRNKDYPKRSSPDQKNRIYVQSRLTPELRSKPHSTEPQRRNFSQNSYNKHAQNYNSNEYNIGERNFFKRSPFHHTCLESKNKTIKTKKSFSNSDYQLELSPKTWNEEKTDEWFSEKKVPVEIRNIMKPYNGDVLYQLYKLRKGAPEFFYQSIASKCSVVLPDILLFTYNLENLFENYFTKFRHVNN